LPATRDEPATFQATPSRAARLATSVTLPIQWQVFACAALCALGATLGLITVLGEMGHHVMSATRSSAYLTAALCAGIVLGLCIPRRIIRRRLERETGDADHTQRSDSARGGDLKVDFAASLSGALIVTFALTWVVLCGGAMLMEEYRAFLARQFLHPIQLTQLLLSAPAYAGLVFAGAAGTTLLVTLHGWYRLVRQPNATAAGLWTSVLLGAMVAGLLAQQVASPTILAWLAPLAVFVAGMIAVWRHSDTFSTPIPAPTQRQLTRDEWLSLLAAGLAAATTGTALSLATPHGWLATQNLAAQVTVLAGAACAGLFAARVLLRLRFSRDWGPLLLLLGAAALSLPYQRILAAPVNCALIRLAAVTTCAATCIVLGGRRVSPSSHSMQHALSWVGGFVAAGFGLTLAFVPATAAHWGPSAPAMIVALVVTAGAGLMLILDSHAKAATRIAGLVCVGLWLAGAPSAARSLAEALPPPEPAWPSPATRPLVHAARRLVTADPFRTAHVQPLSSSSDGPANWQFDLVGPALDVLILEAVTGADARPVWDAALGRRLLKRATTRLAKGGRLLIELPTAPFLVAALDRADTLTGDPAWTGYRLGVRGEADEYEALVFGPDIPALIARQAPLPGFEVSLRPLGTSAAGRR